MVVLLAGLAFAAGALPMRTLIPTVWPGPVEEWVLADGDWILQPSSGNSLPASSAGVRARTRPVSVIEVQFRNGDRERGYLIDKTSGPDGALIVQTGPDEQRIVPVATLAGTFYPNNTPGIERLRLALARLKERSPVSRTPSPH